MSHVLAVSSLVMENGGTEAQAIAALLHDTLEDCEVSEKEVFDLFGPTVARLVSISDKLHNARSINQDLSQSEPSTVWSRFSGSPAEILWYYQGLLEAFRKRQPRAAPGFLNLLKLYEIEVLKMQEQVASGLLLIRRGALLIKASRGRKQPRESFSMKLRS